tara:strand:+ start:7040 stop:7420 length:381 start_codon:yes stop_codon:yes gene_type:complete
MNDKTINLPIAIYKKGNRYSLNLNQYRNWHYQASNQIKSIFCGIVDDRLDFVFEGPVRIKYEYYAPNKRRVDLMNVVSVVDKFFQDAMVSKGCIEADDTSIVKRVDAIYNGIDRENPRLEVTITSI